MKLFTLFLILCTLNANAYLTPIGAGSGTVTGVTGTAPIVSSGGPAPTISCTLATGSVAGCVSTGAQTFAGNKTFNGIIANNGGFASVALGTATSGANFASNAFNLYGSYWNGAAAAQDDWGMQLIVGAGTNPYSVLNFYHVGTPGLDTVYFPAIDNTPIGLTNPSPSSFSTAVITSLLTLPVQAASTPPASPASGSIALTSAFILCVYNGSAWKKVVDGTTACTF
jgi:hypothetical protein